MKQEKSTHEPQNLLILAYFYPPIKIIAVLRSYYFSQNIRAYFSDVHVVTTTNRRRLPTENLPNAEGVKIHEAWTFDYRTLASLRRHETVGFDENAKKSRLAKFIIKLNKSFPTNLLWGEGGLVYILHSFFIAAKLIRRQKIRTVYSSFSPYADHVVARLLKVFFPKLRWIADFRDLHVEPHYDIVYWRGFQHWCNRQILKKADLVTTVSEGLAQHLRAYHPKVYVFRNGIAPVFLDTDNPFDPQNIGSTDSLLNEKNKQAAKPKFTIGYTGSMYGDERNPELLLKVVRDLAAEGILSPDNFQILYAGKDTALWLAWISRFDLLSFFTSRGLVSLKEARQLQENSHINLLLTSATQEWTGVMTGKFYEYLSAQKPVVVLINGVQDIEFESVVADLSAGIVVYHERSYAALRSFVLENFNHFQKKGFVQKTIQVEKLKNMGWPATIEKFVETVYQS
jgi:hypothetical protein